MLTIFFVTAALRKHFDSEDFKRNFSELSKHGCSWGESFSLARVALARSTSPVLLRNLQALTPESFNLELAGDVKAKSFELNKEIDAKLAAKGLKRSVVLGQAASSTSKQNTTSKKRPSAKNVAASKAKKKKGSSSPRQPEPDRSLSDYVAENEALRKELDDEKKRSRRLEKELGYFRRIDSNQAGELDVGTSSAQGTELVPLRKLLSLEDRIERKLEKASNRFLNLMGEPLNALINLREINENIALVEDLKTGKVKDLGVELSKLHDEKEGVKDAETNFFRDANRIAEMLRSEREE